MQQDLTFLGRSAAPRKHLVLIGLVALVAVNSLEVCLPLVLAAIIDHITAGSDDSLVFRLAMLYLGISLAQAVARFSWRVALGKAAAWISHDLRLEVFAKALRMPPLAAKRRSASQFVSLVNSDIENVSRLFGDGVVIVTDAVFMSLYICIIVMWCDPFVGSVILLPCFLIPWLVLRADHRVAAYHADTQRTLVRLTESANESLSNARILKVFNAESAFRERLRGRSLQYVVQSQRLLAVEAFYGPVLEGLISVSMVLLFIVGGHSVLTGTLSLGLFVAFQRYIQQLSWPMRAVAQSAITLRKARVSGDRLLQIEVPSVKPVTSPSTSPAGEGSAVQFNDVTVTVPETEQTILSRVSFSVSPGEKVAIVGDVGSGKSTLLNTLCDPDMFYTGGISIDGIPIEDWDQKALRKRVSYVPQEPTLFQISIADNVLLGSDSGVADGAGRNVHDVCGIAAIDDEIKTFELGFDELVGDRGITLSGGQRQRLCIARALLRSPGLLVLDNALAAVDSETELKIIRNLRQSPASIVFATQRMSTLHLADKIIVLQNGRIEDQGKLEDLLEKSDSWFRRFYDAQQFDEECRCG